MIEVNKSETKGPIDHQLSYKDGKNRIPARTYRDTTPTTMAI